MTDEVQAADDAAPEVVAEADEQAKASEATENTEGQDEDDQPAPEESDDEKTSASKQRRERRKAQLDRLKEEARIAKADKERLAREIERMKGGEKSKPPRREDFDDPDDYIAAKSAHAAAEMLDNRRVSDLEREAAERSESEKRLIAQQRQEAAQNWAAQAEEAREKYADFEAVVTAPDLPVTDEMAFMLGMSDNGADVAYFLGTHKEQARAIAAMPVPEMVGAMRMLEQFVSIQKPRPRTQTRAPEPITPVKPKGTTGKNPEDMTPAEYDKWRAAGGTFKL